MRQLSRREFFYEMPGKPEPLKLIAKKPRVLARAGTPTVVTKNSSTLK
jgi:hypothetical protein